MRGSNCFIFTGVSKLYRMERFMMKVTMQLMPICLSFLILFGGLGCAQKATEGKQGFWPPKGATRVVGYCMDWTQFSMLPIIVVGEDGKESLHPGVIPSFTKTLDHEQIEVLLALSTKSGRIANPSPGCKFAPHHAFVFYGDDETVVGHLSVCLLCNMHRSSPGRTGNQFDYEVMDRLVRSLGMPVLDSSETYTVLFEKE